MAGEFTTDQLEALTAAIAAGVLTVKHGDKQVTYESSMAMLTLRDRMIRELNGRPSPKRHLTTFTRGDRR